MDEAKADHRARTRKLELEKQGTIRRKKNEKIDNEDNSIGECMHIWGLEGG